MFKEFERRLAVVPRWAVIPTIRQQSVAEHCYYVTLYTDKICLMLGADEHFRAQAMAYALRHDYEEAFTGDIPSPANKHMDAKGYMESLDPPPTEDDYASVQPGNLEQVKAVVKLADIFDAYMFLRDEFQMGNKRIERLERAMGRRFYEHLHDHFESNVRFVEKMRAAVWTLDKPDYPL